MRREMVHHTMWRKLLNALPHGLNMPEEDWRRRHRLMLWVLGVHVPALVALGLALGYAPRTVVFVVISPLVAVTLGYVLRHHRRTSSVTVTAGLVYCSAALVGLTHGTIEAHFHFFIIIGFIALYQDWAPLLFNIVFTVISHGIGSAWQQSLIFDHPAGQSNPWLWSAIHGVAVLLACAGMIIFWRFTEDAQREKDTLARRLADSEINRRQFTSDLLTNLARRNQSLLHRQLEIINQLEESERDPDALADLFALDHIATRVRRNAENLLVLSGEQPPRTWSDPVPLRDVLRAAIAETENLERVVFVVDEQSAVVGHTVIDLTHLLAELTENAVRFSPPDATVTVRSRPDRGRPGGRLITIEDWGVGIPAEQLEEANALLATPPDVDLSVSQRLGFHVVARLAARHGIKVALSVTPGSGTTALVSLPPSLFAPLHLSAAMATSGFATAGVAAAPASPFRQGADQRLTRRAAARVEDRTAPETPRPVADPPDWSGWWDPAVASAMPAFNPTPANGACPAVGGPGSPPSNGHPAPPPGLGPATIGQVAPTNGVSANGNGHRVAADCFDPAPTNGFDLARNGPDPTANGFDPTTNGFDPARNGPDPTANGFDPARNGSDLPGDGLHPGGNGAGPRSPEAGGPAQATPQRDPAAHTSGSDVRDDEITRETTIGGDATAIGPGLSTPTYRAFTTSAREGEPHAARLRPSPTPRPIVIDAPPVPAASVPTPRTPGPVDPVSGLRRRIPQSHLSAELRAPEPDAAEPTAERRSTADAAAALSRYQASRAAAQARVADTPSGHANTTDDLANGDRA